jgi:2-C-methyl-D-erythritol 2,4-cyclodiphosphate synthase
VRVGFGYDAHRLTPGRPLVLAGVTVPYDRGLEGFSDGDAAAHAVIDALLGAAALGDCGSHFPAGDARYAGAHSTDLLAQAAAELERGGHRVVNVDCTIVVQEPALAPFLSDMRVALARAMRADPSAVSVKAKRPEGLGFAGDGSGIEAFAVALIETDR